MLRKIVLVLLLLATLFASYVSSRPSEYSVTRSVTVNAAPARVYPLVNDFKSWAQWSPWEQMDPQMKKTFSGPATGAGAQYAWTGNDRVGEGRMVIVSSKPNQMVDINLEFIKPFPASSQTLFTFQPQGSGTLVTWTMRGSNDFMGKTMSVFMNMDEMIGKDFEKGLATLKDRAEKGAATPSP